MEQKQFVAQSRAIRKDSAHVFSTENVNRNRNNLFSDQCTYCTVHMLIRKNSTKRRREKIYTKFRLNSKSFYEAYTYSIDYKYTVAIKEYILVIEGSVPPLRCP